MRTQKSLVYVSLTTAFALSSGLALHASAAAKAPACASFADPAGDATLRGSGAGNDPALDITKVTFLNDGSKLTALVAVPGFKQTPMFGAGNRFEVQFTIAGHVTYLYYNDSSTRSMQENAFYQAGVYVDAARVDGSESLPTEVTGPGTLSISIGLKDLAGAIGTKITSKTVAGAAEVRSRATIPGTFNTFDTAAAPETFKFPLGVCK